MLTVFHRIPTFFHKAKKLRPAHLRATWRAAQSVPSFRSALKKPRRRLLLGFAISTSGVVSIIALSPSALATAGIGIGTKLAAFAFSGSALKETIRAVRTHRSHIESFMKNDDAAS
jgi:hypothetical protein